LKKALARDTPEYRKRHPP